ncbi:MAG: O-antigen ligase family protein, partial [Planctomycetota bacterium]
SISWPYYLVMAYGILVPVIAIHLPGIGGVGAADVLVPIGGMVILMLPRCGRIQVPHVALLCFSFAAVVSLLQISEMASAFDCLIRWIRLFGIFIPFYFGLFISTDDRLTRFAFNSWMVGGLIAVLIGIFLYLLQIEVRSGQQRLWMDGGSMIRAGGLIGNSGAFGHMTSTWAVVSFTWLITVCKHRYRIAGVILVMACAMYVIYISSSRAALLHLSSAAIVFLMLYRMPLVIKHWLPLLVILAILLAVFFHCLNQWGGSFGIDTQRSSVVQSSLARFVPGFDGGGVEEFTSRRSDNWPEYIAMMNQKALVGWGYKMGVRLHEESPDNSYLSVLLETGAFGFICMAMFVLSNLFILGRGCFSDEPYVCVMIPVVVGQLFNCMTSDIYTFWITMPVVFMLLGIVIQRCGNRQERKIKE